MLLLNIVIIILTLVILMIIHELGHFILAKRFGIPVEEFGVGYPPRLWGKRIGGTVYSVNLLPFGAFVKILGEDTESDNPNSFSKQAIWKRALVLVGGVASFWIIAAIMLSFLVGIWGVPKQVTDDETATGAQVLISMVQTGSPAEAAGILPYDAIEAMSSDGQSQNIEKAQQVLNFVQAHKGKMVTLTIKRNGQTETIELIPRQEYKEDEGSMGVGLARATIVKFPWYEAPYQGLMLTGHQTKVMVTELYKAIAKAFRAEKVTGIKFMGPIGLGSVMSQALGQGINVYLSYVVMIAIWLALFNILPIPALDGGQLLFLGLEGLRRKPVSPKVQQRVTGAFFMLLILLMVVVTAKDIIGLFWN